MERSFLKLNNLVLNWYLFLIMVWCLY